MSPLAGDYRVWYIPQIPGTPFFVSAPDLPTAVLLLETLSSFSLFELENNVKPDYADAGGIERYDPVNFPDSPWVEIDPDEESEAL